MDGCCCCCWRSLSPVDTRSGIVNERPVRSGANRWPHWPKHEFILMISKSNSKSHLKIIQLRRIFILFYFFFKNWFCLALGKFRWIWYVTMDDGIPMFIFFCIIFRSSSSNYFDGVECPHLRPRYQCGPGSDLSIVIRWMRSKGASLGYNNWSKAGQLLLFDSQFGFYQNLLVETLRLAGTFLPCQKSENGRIDLKKIQVEIEL